MVKGKVKLQVFDTYFDEEEDDYVTNFSKSGILFECEITQNFYFSIECDNHKFTWIPFYDSIYDLNLRIYGNRSIYDIDRAIIYGDNEVEEDDVYFSASDNSHIDNCLVKYYSPFNNEVIVHYIEDNKVEFYRKNNNTKSRNKVHLRNNDNALNIKKLELRDFIKEFYNFDISDKTLKFTIEGDKEPAVDKKGIKIEFKDKAGDSYKFNLGVDRIDTLLSKLLDKHYIAIANCNELPHDYFLNPNVYSKHLKCININHNTNEKHYVARAISPEGDREIVMSFINDILIYVKVNIDWIVENNLELSHVNIKNINSISKLLGIKPNLAITIYGEHMQLIKTEEYEVIEEKILKVC